MVAAAERKVSKSGKVRTNINGKIAWVYPDELPDAPTLEREPLLGWDGEPVEEIDEDYEAYIASRPTRAQLRPFPEPIYYWEPTGPGVALQPYPSLGEFRSLVTGVWAAHNEAQNTAIRERLQRETGLDPDELRLSEREWDVFNGRAKTPPLRFCHDPGCHWRSSSPLANNIHEEKRGHSTHTKPRET